MVDAVVKVGGRLGHDEGLRGLCLCLGELGSRHRLLIVPGGGVFADAVRDCDARFGLGADAAHWMAILAMDQYGLLLADLTPGAEAVRTLDRARSRLAEEGGVVVLLPSEPLRRADALPHSWSVTSDAIAAWVTQAADGRLLVLLKDHHGMARLAPAAA
ncbi:MAG: amino acid kinase, partial [Actinomycetota bacterium]